MSARGPLRAAATVAALLATAPAAHPQPAAAETRAQVAPTAGHPPAAAEMIVIPGGCLEVGCAGVASCQRDLAAPLRRVCLDSFRIDRTEVTVGAYEVCVRAGKCPAVGAAGAGDGGGGRRGHPVSGVDWAAAAAYCRFLGKRLPTEAEWERAALGPAGQGLPFPWGFERPTCDRAVLDLAGSPPACTRDRPAEPPYTRPVCSRAAGNTSEGLCDVIGNVAEWVSDWYVRAGSRQGASGKNPPGPCAGRTRCPGARGHVLKGGSWNDGELFARVSGRPPPWKPFVREGAGIRCASNAPASPSAR